MISEPCCGEAQSAARDSFQWGKAKMNEKCKTRKAGSYTHPRKARCSQQAAVFLLIGTRSLPEGEAAVSGKQKEGAEGSVTFWLCISHPVSTSSTQHFQAAPLHQGESSSSHLWNKVWGCDGSRAGRAPEREKSQDSPVPCCERLEINLSLPGHSFTLLPTPSSRNRGARSHTAAANSMRRCRRGGVSPPAQAVQEL